MKSSYAVSLALEWLRKAVSLLLVGGAVTIIGIISYQIVAREMGGSLRWTEELARLVSIWTIFLALPLLIGSGRIITIDFFVSFLPDRLRCVVAWLRVIAVTSALVVLVVYTAIQVVEAWPQSSPGLLWPMGVFTLPILLGSVFALASIPHYFRAITTSGSHQSEGSGDVGD